MARLCERPGCSAPASVAYGFEAARTMVWIEPFTPENADSARVGGLCRRHADSLTPPRGWWLDDRRLAVPQLFVVPGAPSAPADPDPAPASDRGPADVSTEPAPGAEPRVVRRERRPRRGTGDPTAELPFVEVPLPLDPPPITGTATGPARPAPPIPAHDHARPPEASIALAAAEPAADPDETKALPWVPSFDWGDDLGGVLAARSPLLARDFGMKYRTDG